MRYAPEICGTSNRAKNVARSSGVPMCSAANSISAQARSCQPAVAGVQAVDVAFTQINSGIYNEPVPVGQLLYLPLVRR